MNTIDRRKFFLTAGLIAGITVGKGIQLAGEDGQKTTQEFEAYQKLLHDIPNPPVTSEMLALLDDVQASFEETVTLEPIRTGEFNAQTGRFAIDGYAIVIDAGESSEHTEEVKNRLDTVYQETRKSQGNIVDLNGFTGRFVIPSPESFGTFPPSDNLVGIVLKGKVKGEGYDPQVEKHLVIVKDYGIDLINVEKPDAEFSFDSNASPLLIDASIYRETPQPTQ